MSKNKKQQNKAKEYYNEKDKFSNMFKYFFKVMLIAFIPIFIVVVILSVVLKGQHEWVIWLVAFILLAISGTIGLFLENKMNKKKNYQEQKKQKGKTIPKKEDIDIFS